MPHCHHCAVPTVSHSVLPGAIYEFIERRPAARIKLLDLSAMEVPIQVEHGKADALCGGTLGT